MKLIVGLGNPGPQYTRTRHNAGFMVIDRLVETYAASQPVKARFSAMTFEVVVSGERLLLVKPTTFMNVSGRSVAEAARFFKCDTAADMLIIVDDFYLPTGDVKLKPAGGAGGHNGLASIQQLLGSEAYPRLRVGVGQLPSGGKPPMIDQSDYVLGRFTTDEEPILAGAITKAVKTVEVFAAKGLAHAMNFANAGSARPAAPAADKPKQPGESTKEQKQTLQPITPPNTPPRAVT